MEKTKLICKICSSDNEELLYTLNCQCTICDDCLLKKINNATDKKIILTNFEKSKFINLLNLLNEKILIFF